MPGFTPSHRGGSGPPLVLLHGFMDTWRVWELVLPALEQHFEVLAPTLPGHAGGPPITGDISHALLADAVERAMDDGGFASAHLVGNSLGGNVALQLAERGRADSVVALAPAGGWAAGDASFEKLLAYQRDLHRLVSVAARQADAILATTEGRRRATQAITVNFRHIPTELLAHQMLGVARCDAEPLIEYALRSDWSIDAERVACPVRIVWGTEDKLLPWPSAAARYRDDWLPHADWVVLDGVGHCPQLDVPLETGHLIAGFSQPDRL
jgi:pimeloyl-ACP methyl ester carboxylesterase